MTPVFCCPNGHPCAEPRIVRDHKGRALALEAACSKCGARQRVETRRAALTVGRVESVDARDGRAR